MDGRELYDQCVKRARLLLEKEFPDKMVYFIENGEVLDLGIHVGVAGTIFQLVEDGLLED